MSVSMRTRTVEPRTASAHWSTAELVLGVLAGLGAGGLLVWVLTSTRETWIVTRNDEGKVVKVSKVAGRGATHALG